MEPQGNVWPKKSGRQFNLATPEIHSTLASFDGIGHFSTGMQTFPYTLFRFPLRHSASSLSNECYTVDKIRGLLEALKEEAPYLLLFLRSVDIINVIEITESNDHKKLFEVRISESECEEIAKKRKDFLDELKSRDLKACKKPYSISYKAQFHVKVEDVGLGGIEEDMESRGNERHWLVTAIVGSEHPEDLKAAIKQKVLPWVGCALELKDETTYTSESGGRIFCFLPLPPETHSPLPVHVNGTFGLNDDRRSLKWPSKDRKHDSTADWNRKIVKSLLPPCYARMIIAAIEAGVSPHHVYSSWPQAKRLKSTPWSELLQPLLGILLEYAVFWSEDTHLNKAMWVSPHNATIIPPPEAISPVVHKVLSACGLHLVDLQIYEDIWNEVSNDKRIKKLSPTLARQKIRFLQREPKYQSLPPSDKYGLLQYCLSDKKYSELEGLQLLPLADGSFTSFEQVKPKSQKYYVCDEKHPCELLPNMDKYLVDLSKEDIPDLHKHLLQIAATNKTVLQRLNATIVARLLPHFLPRQQTEENTPLEPISSATFPPGWLEVFWKWVAKQELDMFKDHLVLPVAKSNCIGSGSFFVTKLVKKANSNVILITEGSNLATKPDLISGLRKLNVYFTGATDSLFPYLQSCKSSLTEYVHPADNHGVIAAMANAYDKDSLHKLHSINFTKAEAESIQHFLQYSTIKGHLREVLMHLPILTCLNRKHLHSVAYAADHSWGEKAVMTSSFENLLPPALVVLSDNHNQKGFVSIFCDKIDTPDMASFILDYLLPMVMRNMYPQPSLQDLMETILLFSLGHEAKRRRKEILGYLKQIPFLKKGNHYVCPSQLFDSSREEIVDIFEGESVFPQPPFNQPHLLPVLCECGLRKSASAQDIVEIVQYLAKKPVTALKVSRAKAVLRYLDNNLKLLKDKVKSGETLKKELCNISQKMKWLPVLGTRPEYYPSSLVWKGESTSQLTRHDSNTLICTPEENKHFSFVAGSEVVIVSCPSKLCDAVFRPTFKTSDLVQVIMKHFKRVITHCKKLDGTLMDEMVCEIYTDLQCSMTEVFHDLPPEWIWIKKKHQFFSVKSVSLQQDLEPYVYAVPESLHKFSMLFKAMGVEICISKSHLLSVLKTIKHTDSGEQNSEVTWEIIMKILSLLTSYGQEALTLSPEEVLYIPTDSKTLHLEDSRKVCYADVEFLKDFVTNMKTEDMCSLCHDKISQFAQSLQLTPLSKHLDISDDLFEDVGQHEPLVNRLKGILRDYTDGLTIFKELLQNADDAGATEVNICYDTRHHTVDPKTLLYPGMAECFGPSLIVHNNAVFTDEDFQSITRLAATTKQNKPLKIGTFGVGFCSVYHITDVPSFVSREYLYIFDPTLQYLGKQIHDKSRPGKRLRFTQKIAMFSKQLVPFGALYGFDPKKTFKGTMFRFPFRSSDGEISCIQYTEQHVQELIEDMKKSSCALLLFLQHVNHITVSQIGEGNEGPRVILDIQKVIHAMATPGTQLVSITCKDLDSTQSDVSNWLVGFHTEKLDFSGQERDSTASVACQLHPPESSTPQEHKIDPDFEGEVFCFLPLSVQSGLPVHVSANFAVLNDRTGIRSSKESSTGANEAEWNVDLMKSTIPQAYMNLILCLSQMDAEGRLENYNFHSLWPSKNCLKAHNPWDNLIAPLFCIMAKKNVFYSTYTKAWLTISECLVLSPNILSAKQNEIPVCVRAVIQILKMNVVDLPQEYRLGKHLPLHTLSQLDFVKIVFERIEELKPYSDTRNEVLLLIMRAYCNSELYDKADLKEILRRKKCIPCTPDGKKLKYCNEIIDHKAFFAELYEPNEGVFPIEEFREPVIHEALIELGVISHTLPVDELIKRAVTIEDLFTSNRIEACKRTRLILECVKECSSDHDILLQKLKSIKLLPVQQRPEDYPAVLPWKGDLHNLLTVNEIYCGKSCHVLAGSQVCTVCMEGPDQEGCGQIDSKVIRNLKIYTHPPFSAVVEHFCHIIDEYIMCQHGQGSAEPFSKEWIDRVCPIIYDFFETSLGQDDQMDLSALLGRPCIWTGSKFVCSCEVAKKWTHDGPYLFRVPNSLVDKENLLMALKIRSEFSIQDIVQTLEKISKDFNHQPVTEDCSNILFTLVLELQSRLKEGSNDPRGLECYLPDSELVMRKASKLHYNDAPWCAVDMSDTTFVHNDIPRDFALSVGVRPVRGKFLDLYEDYNGEEEEFEKVEYYGEEFGQREDLTQRIKNIIRDYPMDITILKELLQNADDAKATKMFVILDKRTHGMKTLPSDEWKDLQGPALLVWNNSIFQEDDLKGIQKLGLGRKKQDTETIGMYGIGFNAVYHLTDCPSFISTEDNGKCTLCVFDPHCRYIPGAKQLCPGRRFNNLDQRFWEQWSDLRSAYFQDDIPDLPAEMKSGSLFRFPLRHSKELVEKSKLLESSLSKKHTPLYAWKMQEMLNDWAPDMKETLFFLRNVTEVGFFVIDDSATLHPTHWYKATLNEGGQESRRNLQNKVCQFENQNTCPHVEMYTLTVKDEVAKHSEEWLIQQGVGDVHNPKQCWKYLPHMKPKHGIAAPLHFPKSAAELRQKSRIFCFLPLPIKAHLPVLVNGSFVLDSARRRLWQSHHLDDKAQWNQNLIEAIASSYAEFLVKAQQIYIDPSGKDSEDALIRDITQYYNLFPVWQDEDPPEGECLSLVKKVYDDLYRHNASVLARVQKEVKEVTLYKAVFLPLQNMQTPQDQVYFYEKTLDVEVVSVLQSIGMHLTVAPKLVHNHFSAIGYKLPEVTRQSVFDYYAKFHCVVLPTEAYPLFITDTKFGSVQKFKAFINYLLEFSTSNHMYQFPASPLGIPLLLTADCQIQKFDTNQKKILSQFCSLFPKSRDKFLHPELMNVSYPNDSFLSPGDENWPTVCDIVSCNLPEQLKGKVVVDASEYVNPDFLKHLWECLSSDPFFIAHRNGILGTWALIPSTEKQLFSSRSQILPITMTDSMHSATALYQTPGFSLEEVFAILKKCDVPVLDKDVVSSKEVAESLCPQVSKPATIVETLYNLHNEHGVLHKIILLPSEVKVLLKYFGTIHLVYDRESLKKIKSLPLFKNMDGTFSSIPTGSVAFVWPGQVCEAGKETWLHGVKGVFLDEDGDWTHLQAQRALNVQCISPFGVYNKYIFPVFEKLSMEQRMDHLVHIRDQLYNDAEQCKGFQMNDRQKDAREFTDRLKALHCLLKDGKLRPACEFVDPQKNIFTAFKSHFHFPPTDMTSETWLTFLRNVGLRTTITTKEFLQFCYELELGRHSDIAAASHTLLEYLFQEKEWHTNEYSYILGQVSRIAFVCVEPLPSISWIKACAQPEKTVTVQGETVQLTSLCKAAEYKDHKLMWTVKPIVKLPEYPFESSYRFTEQRKANLIQKLRVTDASVKSVVQNIVNISNTPFSDFQMFQNYSCKQMPKQGESILQVLVENFNFLSENPTTAAMSSLTGVPCIPVCAEGNVDKVKCPVLVKPSQVIALRKEMLAPFKPFLNPLPNELYSILPHILTEIGVEQAILPKHVRAALETIHKSSKKQSLDDDTQKTVYNLLHKLYELLNNKQTSDLMPLYLPNSEFQLRDSTKLLYHDSEHFRRKNFHFTRSEYSQFSLEKQDMQFHEKQLCCLLPAEVAPKPFSNSCKEVMSKKCHAEASLSSLAQGLKKAFSQRLLPGAAKAILCYSQPKEICDKLIESLDLFFNNIEVLTVKHLTVEVSLTVVNPYEYIGTAEVDFLIERNDDNTFVLFVDDKARQIFFYENLSSAIMSQAAEMGGVAMKDVKEPQKTLVHLLKAQNSDDIRSTLRELNVPFGDDVPDEEPREALTPTLGDQIPDFFHYMLQQDMNKLFQPGEWVGYEKDDDTVIFALIGHKIKEDQSRPFAEYFIYVKEDLDGIEVSIITIFKIIPSAKKGQSYEGREIDVPRNVPKPRQLLAEMPAPLQTSCNIGAMRDHPPWKYTASSFLPPRREDRHHPMVTYTTQSGQATPHLSRTKEEIRTKLSDIWKLQDHLRQKAVKRLYLKWHPKKNPDNHAQAEEVSKFLKQQIVRLESDEPLNDADDQQSDSKLCEPWESLFHRWDEVACQHYQYQQSGRGSNTASKGRVFDISAFVGPTPEPQEAQIWIKQAGHDFEALTILSREMHRATKVCATVCFLAHEVAEKSLKAGMLAVCGLHPADCSSHKKLYSHACALEQLVPNLSAKGLSKHVETLPIDLYYKTRWPNQFSPLIVPADAFNVDIAQEAERNAQAVLEMMKTVVKHQSNTAN